MGLLGLLSIFVSSFALAEGSGKIIFEGNGFTSRLPDPVPATEERVDFLYDRDVRVSRSWTFRFHPSLRATSAPEAWGSTAIVDPRELNFEHERNGRFWKVGFFTPKWEGTDGVNPMDIATMKDWSDPLRAQTLASAGLQFSRSGESVDFEMFWVPRQTRPILFGKNSAWLPRRLSLPLSTDEVELRLPDRVDYLFDDREDLDHALTHNGGFRFQVRGESVDFALAGFEGASDLPMLRPILDATAIDVTEGHQILLLNSPIHLQPMDYRRRTGAVYCSWTLGTTIFRASVRHDQSLGDDVGLPGWSEQGIAGFEQSFAVGENTVTVLLQGAFGRRAESVSVLSFSELFDRAVLWGLRWPVGENWNVLLSGFTSQHDSSSFAQIEVAHRWSDEWSSEFFSQNLSGPSTSLTGLLADRDRLGFRILRSF